MIFFRARTTLLSFWLVLFFGAALAVRAADAAAPIGPKPHDVLVYKDGDRIQGKLISKTETLIIFQSERFGELRVPADAAVVIPAEKPEEPSPKVVAETRKPAPNPVAKAEQAKVKAHERAEAEKVSVWEHFSPAVLTAELRDFFGPWHGKLSFSTEVVDDSAKRSAVSAEALLDRKWKTNEVQLKGRYDFAETAGVPTTDMLKAEGMVRHDFSSGRFVLYHPSIEWNRASFTNGAPSDYLLLQQEFGGGYSLLATPAHKLRVGLSENVFDTWTILPTNPHSSRSVQSAFLETEVKMPWRMTLTDRAVYYYSITSHHEGWENHVELTKKFTETLSTAIRHEVREGSKDISAQDYTRLKLLVGLDF